MNSNRIVRRAAAGIACFSFVALAASCGPVDEEALTGDEIASSEPVDSESLALQGWCPDGWVDPDFVAIDCIQGYEIRSRVFHGNVCVRCARGDDNYPGSCSYPWVRNDQLLDCERGDRVVYRGQCKRCARGDDGYPQACSYPWVRDNQYLDCDYGERLIYEGRCKRCVRDQGGGYGECTVDADCMRTGCSGQLCSAQQEITTCEWRPEYACYENSLCGCNYGQCDWARTPRLVQCLYNTRGY